MDIKRSWLEARSLPGLRPPLAAANYKIHFDGGSRGSVCSSSAWILEATFQTGDTSDENFDIVAMAGIYLETAVSSFMAEILAFDDCMDYFLTYLNGCPRCDLS